LLLLCAKDFLPPCFLQSVVLSGGYEDDHDEGEWFLYTGSGGRDLSGNKRTNKVWHTEGALHTV
jgi:hypothetical protein